MYDRHGLTGSETHTVHRGGGVVAGFAQPRGRIAALLCIVHRATLKEEKRFYNDNINCFGYFDDIKHKPCFVFQSRLTKKK